MSTIDRTTLQQLLPALDPTAEGTLGERLNQYSNGVPDEAAYIRSVRDSLTTAYQLYLLEHAKLSEPRLGDSVTHGKFRQLREVANELVGAMDKLVTYDPAVAADAAELRAQLKPVLMSRGDKYRADKAAQVAGGHWQR